MKRAKLSLYGWGLFFLVTLIGFLIDKISGWKTIAVISCLCIASVITHNMYLNEYKDYVIEAWEIEKAEVM